MGATQSSEHPHVLLTSRGKLRGIEQQDRSGKPILRRYLRIPYAKPPVGDLRWRRPQPLPPRVSFDDAKGNAGDYSSFGPICPQPEYNTGAALVDNPDAAPEVENVQSEDCLYLNIWVPAGMSPRSGWPVQFFIHGGWLQVGDANQSNNYDPFDLIVNTKRPRIIVAPTYRLNLFGFAAGADLASSTSEPFTGNFGLWDQRLALEWTHANIALFGGDPNMITVGGLSAGAHSAFLQLYHDTHLPDDRRIIKQAHLWSNALAIQPNPATSDVLTSQFESICTELHIDPSNTAEAKLQKLRATRWQDLLAVIPHLKQHTFRSCTDGPIEKGGFVPPTMLSSINDGSFATLLAKQGVRILLGEVRDEAQLYRLVNPPGDYDELVTQVGNYYPRPVVDALVKLPLYGVPGPEEPNLSPERWADIFSEMVADCQVHASLRGLTRCLLEAPAEAAEGLSVQTMPRKNVFRYKICWRAKGLDNWLKPEVGVCHSADTPIWWASGFRADYTKEDKQKCLAWIDPFGRFLHGEADIGWGSVDGSDKLILLDEDGMMHENMTDEHWRRGLEIWDAVWNAQKDKVEHTSRDGVTQSKL